MSSMHGDVIREHCDCVGFTDSPPRSIGYIRYKDPRLWSAPWHAQPRWTSVHTG